VDYPKSVPSVGLVNGKFVDENPVTGTPGSLIPAAWGNGVTQEILNVLAAAGIVPDELKADQLSAAISKIVASGVTWSLLSGKPTTLAGYGITDALAVGQYGLGANVAPRIAIDTVGLPGGFYSYLDGNTSFGNYVGLVNIPYTTGGYAGQLGFQQGNPDTVVLVRGCDQSGKWTPTRQLWHDGNLKPGDMFPVGTTIQYAGPYPPAGFLKENGAEVSRTVYAKLFAAIGTFYGPGDGATTFNVPDSRGEFIRGFDDGRGIDPQRVLGSLQLDSMQGHWHGPRPGTTLNGSPGSWNGNNGTNGGYNIGSTGDPVTNGVNGIPRTSNETRPRNTSRLMCIKY
jgi:phage-related tail fiber protein